MKNKVVMTAIERRMKWIYETVICNPANRGKDLTFWKEEISDLHDAYFELRGNKSFVNVVEGIDVEPNSVDNIYKLTVSQSCSIKKRETVYI